MVGLALLQAEEPPGGTELEVLADSAYGTGQAWAALAQARHVAIIKPGPLRPAIEGGFTIDETAGTMTCPNGITRRITRTRAATFGAACRSRPLRERRTTSRTGRTVRLHPQDAVVRQARGDWAANPWLRDTHRQHRPMAERSIAWLIGPKNRCRQLRYRGTSAGERWLHTRMAALNLRRMINLGLQRTDDGWMIPNPACQAGPDHRHGPATPQHTRRCI